MKRKDRTKVVIFIFTDREKVLVEKRFLETLGENHYLLPGGAVKEEETFDKQMGGAITREDIG